MGHTHQSGVVSEEWLWLSVVGPVVPDLVGEVTKKEAPNLLGSGVFAVEESSGGEVLGIPVELELFVRSEVLFGVVL